MTLFSIPPHVPFLRTLADRILDGTLLGDWDRGNPFWLSDVTVILPTRRARLALAEVFATHPEGRGLLPDLRTFGGEAAEEEPFIPPFEDPPAPPPASAVERRLVLSRLVAKWAFSPVGQDAFSSPPTAGEIFSMADSLGSLIDDLLTEERTARDIRAIVPELGPDLGRYWQQTLQFLDIALQFWPAHLQEVGREDATRLRGERLDRQALAAGYLYGDRPVIAAGSTGSIPATARLLDAIRQLPRGAVVLPGLDCSLTPQGHEDLLDPINAPHGHPQYGLARLLRRMGAAVSEVIELGGGDDTRTRLVRTALALPKDTALWPEQQRRAEEHMPLMGSTATTGLSILHARNQDEEARAVALAARASLEAGETVGIVTPDRNLARRIAAELKRFDIWVDDAAGAPLFQSAAGRLIRQILAVAVGGCAAVDIVALLRNRAASFGLERVKVARLADTIELQLLRGQRTAPGLNGLREKLAEAADPAAPRPLKSWQVEGIADLFNRISDAMRSVDALLEAKETSAADLAHCLDEALRAVADGTDLPGRAEWEDWAEQMRNQGGDGHRFRPHDLDGVLAALMTGFSVRTREDRRRDIAIWGQLEARLQNPDLLILSGLNEDIWPEIADPGPWLSRGMRLAAGLEPPERRQGQAAHDFAQSLGNAQVLVSWSARVGTSPAQPSRLLQRLEAFAGEGLAKSWEQRGEKWIAQARSLDAVTEVRPASRPAPNPPVDVRPRSLSVTAVETLMRSPYDIYARDILRLRPLDALGELPDARERGTTIHEILSRFVREGHDVLGDGADRKLSEIAAEEFGKLHVSAELRDIWLRRFSTAASQFLEFEREREPLVKQRHAEIKGRWELPIGFTLTGQADRVDQLSDGKLEIMDFKTGSVPQPGQMKAFEAPQLLLEAAMARAGAMEGMDAAEVATLTYVKIGLGPEAFQPQPFRLADGYDTTGAADEIFRRLQLHVEHFLLSETPMPARLLPLKTQRFPGAYEHLARQAEWTAVAEDEEDVW